MLKILKDRFLNKIPSLLSRRSGKWAALRKAFLKDNQNCAVCGGSSNLEVHHIIPFHIDSSKELDKSNLITLCERGKGGINCHLVVGHLGDFRDCNINVREHASLIKDMIFTNRLP